MPGTDDLHNLSSVLSAIVEKAIPIASRAVAQCLEAIQRRTQVIPGATEANQAGRKDEKGRPIGWYERNKGYWYPVKKIKTLGDHPTRRGGAIKLSKKQQAALSIAGYKNDFSSEQSRFKWRIKVTPSQSMVEGSLENEASYSGAVFGWKADEPRQATLMASIGWRSIDDGISEANGAMQSALGTAADEIVKSIAGG